MRSLQIIRSSEDRAEGEAKDGSGPREIQRTGPRGRADPALKARLTKASPSFVATQRLGTCKRSRPPGTFGTLDPAPPPSFKAGHCPRDNLVKVTNRPAL
jgi:hypothetical protein